MDSAVEDYPVPGHGWLRLLVPAEWQVQYVYVDDASTPPTFYVTPLEGSDFELTVTVYWHDGLDRNITSAEALRERVQKAGEEALQAATDQELKIKAIEGAKQPGFLYDLSDANAQSGQFHYLTQGALAVGQLVLAFTLFTDERPSAHREACLQMLRGARQVRAFRGVAEHFSVTVAPVGL